MLDPTDYDASELRSVAEVDGVDPGTGASLPRAAASGHRPPAPDEPTHEQCERLVAVGGVDMSALGDRPYLESFPDGPEGRRIGRDWLAHLVTVAGEREARAAIACYRARGWIGDEAAATLDARVDDAVAHLLPGEESLDRADHLLSFAHVVRLLGVARR